ncbi:S9 family peptidase [Granulicella tundricola]|uniref:WD40-like beta Propeller containing protein n=1 Tax=Granulicella tundricola (strain ATCC BAA-1859 / DSM 23138 / MP5ACTX9) TaxID=1198114 RepID=E8WZL1_GRATM|nr:S9 family peptidase [Granulicella tundricola]ADW69985.1 WD40-like beta Propeller containing protein [Granulicella tundricola MP5ACTX9]
MTFYRFLAGALPALALSAFAQSGTPALMTPLAHPDPRLATIHSQMGRAKAPGQVAISPDASTLAYTLRSEGSPIHLTSAVNPDPAKEKLVSPGSSTTCGNYSPVWSPDSQWLAYTSSCTTSQDKPGQDQIFLYSRATGESKQLTHLNGLFQEVAWAPDGKSLAFLFVQDASRSAGALAAMKPWAGVIGEDGVEVQRIYAVDVATGKGSFQSPLTLHVYEFGYSPSSKEITYIAADAPGENNWWVAQLYAAPIKMGQNDVPAQPRGVFDPNTSKSALHGLQIAVPRWSPDGKHIAFIGGLMSDQGSTGGDVWVVDAKGGEATDITPNIDGTPTFLSWTGNDSIGFVEDRSGHTLLTDYTVSTRKQDATQDLGETSIGGGSIKNAISVSTNGTLAFTKAGHDLAPEIWAGPFNAEKQITHLNDGAKPGAHTESVEWENEGFRVQGWLTYPASYDASKKYPLIVTVHGGPSASSGASFGGSVWAQLGYFVFSPNPRGSFGQGEKFTAANIKDFGYGDLRDITSGMDAIEKKVSIDKSREGLMGWSYGGFMTMFGVTQTHRFKAAVAGAGISDWKSYYGENSIDQWMVPFFGHTVYDDPAVYAKSSAIEYIKQVTTPTLVVVGDRDGECPAPQSFEFWHALRAEGVKTQLVVFPNEGHGFRDPAHIRDLEAREVAWFAENMPAK